MNMLPTRDICLLFVVLCSVWTAISFGETLQNSDDKVGQGQIIRNVLQNEQIDLTILLSSVFDSYIANRVLLICQKCYLVAIVLL